MENFLTDFVKKLSGSSIEHDLEDAPVSSGVAVLHEKEDDSSSLSRVLFGSIGAMTGFHFPSSLIGGCCPRVVGEEEAIVWNAASEASDSERVHVVWKTVGDKIWYLAVSSADLASHPGTWCPFAALLPNMKDAAALPVTYTYYSDEVATMMTISQDRLLIHRGSPAVLRVKAERLSREGEEETKIIELTPDVIEKLTPAPWYSVSLFEDRARRILAAVSVAGALVLTGFAFLVWMLTSMAVMGMRANLDTIQERTASKSKEILLSLRTLQGSPMRAALAKFTELNEGLLDLNGYLEFYRVAGSKVIWRATIPSNITANRISEIGGRTLESTPTGVVIGSGPEALDPSFSKKR